MLGLFLNALILSAVAFILFGLDKAAAKVGRRRIPESSLLVVSLLAGWPGAMLAQRIFHHKTRKAPFQRTFRLVCLINLLLTIAFVVFVSAR